MERGIAQLAFQDGWAILPTYAVRQEKLYKNGYIPL
jgi:hypothetical protein